MDGIFIFNSLVRGKPINQSVNIQSLEFPPEIQLEPQKRAVNNANKILTI